jgi:hypothetical protein
MSKLQIAKGINYVINVEVGEGWGECFMSKERLILDRVVQNL